jgi:hypothetical protein
VAQHQPQRFHFGGLWFREEPSRQSFGPLVGCCVSQ